MAIFRKEHVAPLLFKLEKYYETLHQTLKGTPAPASLADQYGEDPQQFSVGSVQIDLNELSRAIGHFKVEVDILKKLEKDARKTLHRG